MRNPARCAGSSRGGARDLMSSRRENKMTPEQFKECAEKEIAVYWCTTNVNLDPYSIKVYVGIPVLTGLEHNTVKVLSDASLGAEDAFFCTKDARNHTIKKLIEVKKRELAKLEALLK